MCALVTGVQTCALPIFGQLVVVQLRIVLALFQAVLALEQLDIAADVADAAFIFGRVHPRFHHDFVDGGRDRGRQRDARADRGERHDIAVVPRSEEHTSELQSLMRISYAVFCLKKKKNETRIPEPRTTAQKFYKIK